MPSGGYGINQEDWDKIRAAFDDEVVKRYGMELDWCAAYVTARVNGASPDRAAMAAYVEWDL